MKAKRFRSVWDAIEGRRDVAENMKVRAGLMIALTRPLLFNRMVTVGRLP